MEYHKDRYEDASLVMFKDDALFAVLPGNKDLNIFHSHQGLTYGGLIFRPYSKLEDIITAFKDLLKYLKGEGFEKLWLKELPNIYKKHQDDTFNYLSFKLKGVIFRKDILSVVEPQNLKLSNSRREGLKRATKNNLILKEVDDLSDFWNTILIPNLREKHRKSPVHSLDEITKLKQSFSKNIRQFNVYHSNRLVAGATIFETKNVAHAQYISGNEEKNELGSIDFLHIKLITDIFQDKPYFDFGMSHTASGQINKGLHFWKEGFGSFSVAQNFVEIETKNYPLLDSLFS
ncbi:GNAT family N-acetyltransferase [Winogradskyella sp. A3E31]|uniref:GNAT family N-acetyltransferase n=1 Tax=Winogradskyella sp. A3E31 TaxID=3349637 RepID=UPI00398B9B20